MRKVFNSAVFVLTTIVMSAQIPAIGQWRDHLSYNEAIAVAEGTDRVYCASYGGIFAVLKADNSMEKISRTNGLSDIGISTLNVNPYNNKLIVGYKNGNIDVIKNKTITNVPDLKNSSLLGNKTINSIYFINQFAYLSCGFGIIVFDTERLEIKDTYFIGLNASYVNVLDITSDGQNLYAATVTSIYKASLSSPNLANFSAWSQMTGAPNVVLPTGKYNQITYFAGKVYASFSKFLTSGSWNQDTVYAYNPTANTWTKFQQGITCFSLKSNNGYLVFLHYDFIEEFDQSLTRTNFIYSYSFASQTIGNSAIKAMSGLDIWVADKYYGMVHCVNSTNSDRYCPNGPHKSDVYAMDYQNGIISLAPGSHADNWGNVYNIAGLSTFANEQWSTNDSRNYPILGTNYDFICTAVDPNSVSHVFYGSLGFGVFEFTNGVLTNKFNRLNSTLRSSTMDTNYVGVGGMAYDAKGNLWVTNMLTGNFLLHCREPNGTWHGYDVSSVIGGVEIGQVIVGKNGYKWAILPRGRGILVYDDRGTLSNTSDDRMKRLTFVAGSGKLSGTDVLSIVEDRDQQIWVGTDAGICVFYNPDNIFASSGFDAQQILIQQGAHTQLLMETQSVTALAIDGANRKWIGTGYGGAFLMSGDGTQQVSSFSKTNSPLLSNTINAITINQKSGEIFFGTDKGLVSFRGTATEGSDGFSDVYAFPNPVKHDYEGTIAVKGLTRDAEIKITDINGQLIFQTKSLGGQAIWDGKNFKGERAHTGVYIVFCSDIEGKQTYVTKILFIN